eukprot:TRINITY_DN36542_c0_g1_i1.p2 TRINITY_DN36542_c0_g1~~TRINITY_DN36542_c0_g1_i1.p2  ORF type:complete len:102 (-),score=7.29 TRINITY_DN36542_c0_g1_i1:245-550(-)
MPMQVIALISGGKDSCYAMMECARYGHQVVALANLCPMDDATDELDSFMYQTRRQRRWGTSWRRRMRPAPDCRCSAGGFEALLGIRVYATLSKLPETRWRT